MTNEIKKLIERAMQAHDVLARAIFSDEPKQEIEKLFGEYELAMLLRNREIEKEHCR